jgi:hypothetical protein
MVKFNFIEFMKFRWELGLKIKNLEVGSIGLLIFWLFQVVFPFFLAHAKALGVIMKYMIEKIPEKVLEYTIYLFDIGKQESEVRAELSQKGWNKKTDQDDIFEALAALNGFQQHNRE